MIKKDKEKYHLPITVSLRTSPQTGVAIHSPLQRPDAAERMDKMEYYVYILSNKMNTAIYTGITRDLIRRIYEHKHHVDPNSYTAK